VKGLKDSVHRMTQPTTMRQRGYLRVKGLKDSVHRMTRLTVIGAIAVAG
jgi:hypothetical protein